ncbi:MAG: lysozyme inhibitor LprI family protein [Pseudomonadota bacterium]
MKIKLLSYVIIIVFGLSLQTHAIDTTQDITALHIAAEKGDARSQLEYGKAIRDKSKAEAAIWVQKAADQGLSEAWFWLGYAGLGKEQEVFYYKKAADVGHPDAFRYLLDKLLFRAESAANVKEAKKYADLARKFNIEYFNSTEAFETADRCYEAGSPVIPASDLPSTEEKTAFKNSSVDCWYFQVGVEAPQDWNQYRKCLLSQEYINNNDLAEIYANGWGVKRNPQLAIALVCHGSIVPVELEVMVETLYSTRNQQHLQAEFYFCDHATSGMSSGSCAARAEEIAVKRRDKELTKLMSQWTEAQKNAFYILQNAASNFFSEHATSEQDMSGSARNMFAINEENRLKNKMLNDIKDLEAGNFPKDVDFVRADADLNIVYKQIMNKNKSDTDYYNGAITKEGIKSTQKEWLKYRDSWVKFIAARYPDRSLDLWKTWLTLERIEQLKEIEL